MCREVNARFPAFARRFRRISPGGERASQTKNEEERENARARTHARGWRRRSWNTGIELPPYEDYRLRSLYRLCVAASKYRFRSHYPATWLLRVATSGHGILWAWWWFSTRESIDSPDGWCQRKLDPIGCGRPADATRRAGSIFQAWVLLHLGDDWCARKHPLFIAVLIS